MAIAFDAKSNSGEVASLGSPFQKTFSHTCGTLTKGILLVCSGVRNSNNSAFVSITGITYNGTALTLAKAQNGPSSSRYLTGEIWYLLNPSSGANNIVVTYSGAVDTAYIQGVSFDGVDQASPIDATAGLSTSTGNPWTTSITTVAANAWIVNSLYTSSDVALSANNGETTSYNTTLTVNHNPDQAAVGYRGPIATPAATTTGWNNGGAGNDEGVMSVISLTPYVAAANTRRYSLTLTGLG